MQIKMQYGLSSLSSRLSFCPHARFLQLPTEMNQIWRDDTRTVNFISKHPLWSGDK